MPWLALYSRRAAYGLYVTMAVFFFTELAAGPVARVLAGLAFEAAVLHWAMLDASRHGKSFEHGFAIVFTATLPVSAAYYFVWTRGRRGLLGFAKGFGLTLAIFVVIGIVTTIAGVLNHPKG